MATGDYAKYKIKYLYKFIEICNSNIASKVIIKKAHVDNFIKICKKFMKKLQLPNETPRTMNLIEFNENFITPAYKFLIKGN